MLNTITSFFHMGGYGFYVWSSYGSVLAFLFMTWIVPYKQWRNYLRKESNE